VISDFNGTTVRTISLPVLTLLKYTLKAILYLERLRKEYGNMTIKTETETKIGNGN